MELNRAENGEGLLDAALQLHRWRERANGRDLGVGADPYGPSSDYAYAEAYAVWGMGYTYLYLATGDHAYITQAESSAAWLLDNRLKRYANLAWGLPWKWERRNAPADLGYGITSVFCGELLLLLHEATGRARYLDAVESVCRWLVEENGYVQDERGFWFRYARHRSFDFPVWNVSSKAAGLLRAAGDAIGDSRWAELADAAVNSVCSQQRSDGSFPYSDERPIADNVHTGFTLEGLLSARGAGSPIPEAIIRSGSQHYGRGFFRGDGFGYEVKDRRLLYRMACVFGVLDREAPLWAYAAALRVFGRLDAESPFANCGSCSRILKRLSSLRNDDGSFRFRGHDGRRFIRQEGHMFYALCLLWWLSESEEASG